jgi:hypothetical protein
LDQKSKNLAENVKNLKTEINSLKLENKKLEKLNNPKTKNTKSISSAKTSNCHLVNSQKVYNPTQSKSTFSTNQNNSCISQIFTPMPQDDSTTTLDNLFSTSQNPWYPLPAEKPLESWSSSLSPSMVSNWIPIYYTSTFQSPASLSSMVTHCAKLPAPGDTFILTDDVLQEMKKWIEEYWKKQ